MGGKFETTKPERISFEPVFLIGEIQSCTSLLSRFFKKNLDFQWDSLNYCIAKYQTLLPQYGNLHEKSQQSTLISDLLNELPIKRWCRTYRSSSDIDEIMKKVTIGTYEAVLQAIFSPTLHIAKPSYKYHFEKVTHSQEHLSIVAKIFPHARFIYLVRDGRDAAIKDFHKPFSIRNAAIAALKWKLHVESISSFIDSLSPEKVLKIFYEEIFVNPESIHALLVDFLQIMDTDDLLLDNFRENSHHNTIRDYPGRWMQEFTNEDVLTFENIAGNLLKSNGYPLYSYCEHIAEERVISTGNSAQTIISPPIRTMN